MIFSWLASITSLRSTNPNWLASSSSSSSLSFRPKACSSLQPNVNIWFFSVRQTECNGPVAICRIPSGRGTGCGFWRSGMALLRPSWAIPLSPTARTWPAVASENDGKETLTTDEADGVLARDFALEPWPSAKKDVFKTFQSTNKNILVTCTTSGAAFVRFWGCWAPFCTSRSMNQNRMFALS